MSVTTQDARSEQDQVLPLIMALKKALSRKYMNSLNADFINDVRTLNFTVPKRMDGKPSSRLSSHSTSGSVDLEQPSEAQVKRETRIGYSSKKVNEITEYLLQFEERCFVGRIINETQLRSLRSLNRGILGRILENAKLFKHQSSLPIAINILMFNSSKMKIPKDTFKDLISELYPAYFGSTGTTSIQCIKKSPTYELLKSVIKCQV